MVAEVGRNEGIMEAGETEAVEEEAVVREEEVVVVVAVNDMPLRVATPPATLTPPRDISMMDRFMPLESVYMSHKRQTTASLRRPAPVLLGPHVHAAPNFKGRTRRYHPHPCRERLASTWSSELAQLA